MQETGNVSYVEVADQSQLPEGGRLLIEVDGKSIVLFSIAGNLFALEDQCTHDGGLIGEGRLEGNFIVCPRHGARFDVITGKALSLPAVVDLKTYPVKVINNMIHIGIWE